VKEAEEYLETSLLPDALLATLAMLDLRVLLVLDLLATEVWRSRKGFFVSLIGSAAWSSLCDCL
jgi:hypothetical protein